MRGYEILQWTPARDAELCRLRADALSSRAIGTALNISPNAVTARLRRLREKGDTRVPPAGPNPAVAKKVVPLHRLPLRDRLADLMANKDPSFAGAAYQLDATEARVRKAWSEILEGLGWQAA